MEDRSLSSDCDHWDISSKQSLQKESVLLLTRERSNSADVEFHGERFLDLLLCVGRLR